ncbi:MAG: tRNA (adenosine(37)-N6)-threonylcarbamoyltransferase complex ATPase subunit type 1 TsaE [Polyangiaceae bacterium]|nr:tRNA (adenosine(37)-N6)-threonylcarbamoyltransferase complex ATPase subunit type 1 TsaE [Polyangiaceae bacterium]
MSSTLALPTRGATIALARRLAAALAPGDLLLLEGPLGAGKTYLSRALVRALGVDRRTRVTSPTFALVHTYAARLEVWHADLYRVISGPEVDELGLRAARDAGAALLVEWGARFCRELGGDALLLTLSVEPRTVALEASGPRARALLEGLPR